MKTIAKIVLGTALATAALLAQAQTADEARGLLRAAAADVQAKGLDATVKDINAGSRWRQGELYVVVVRFDGLMLAHSANDKMVGKNMLEAKAADGKFFIKETIAAVKAGGDGEVGFRWGNPATKQLADTVMYSTRAPGQEAYIGAVLFK